jgi:hypothetical protein
VSRYLIALRSAADRARAMRVIAAAPAGTRIEVKAAKRTTPQNDRMWAHLSDIALQLPWHGVKLSPSSWKLVFMDALKTELRMVPNIDGTGFVNLGRASSDLSKSEMSNLLSLIEAFAAQHGVTLHDERVAA